jgi:hypothetical protein
MAEQSAAKPSGSFNTATLGAFGISAVIHALIFLVVGTVVVFESPLVSEFFVSDSIDVSAAQEMDEEPVILEEHQPLPDVAPTETIQVAEAGGGEAATPADLIIASIPAPSTSAFALPKNVGSPTGLKFGAGSGGTGKGKGGPGRGVTASIFGKSIKASKLGVVLDVSFSAHPLLDYAITEIQNGFPDAILMFAPGCELNDRPSEIVPVKEYEKTSKKYDKSKYPKAQYYTKGFIDRLVQREDFKDIWEDAGKSGNGYVIFSEVKGNHGLGGIKESFEYLMDQGADVIYWFADFDDKVQEPQMKEVLKKLQKNNVKVMMHDFKPPLGKNHNTAHLNTIAEKTGGEFFLKTADKNDKKKKK